LNITSTTTEQQVTDNNQQTTTNRQQPNENQQTTNRQQPADYNHQTTTNQQHQPLNDQTTTITEQQTDNNGGCRGSSRKLFCRNLSRPIVCWCPDDITPRLSSDITPRYRPIFRLGISRYSARASSDIPPGHLPILHLAACRDRSTRSRSHFFPRSLPSFLATSVTVTFILLIFEINLLLVFYLDLCIFSPPFVYTESIFPFLNPVGTDRWTNGKTD